MKKRKKMIIPAAVLTGVTVGGGLHLLNISQPLTHQSSIVSAYTSPTNQQEPATAPDSYQIKFTDINLKQALNKALRNQLNDPSRPLGSEITVGEAKRITSFVSERTLENSNITNLEGLQYFVNLVSANISENNIADLAPIADLPKLQYLDLSKNQNVTSIEPLARIPKLKKLQFGMNKVTDFSALVAAPMLEELEINSIVGGVLNMSSLSGLTKLKVLNLNGNNLKSDSFGPIKNLPQLSKITIGGNSVVDLQEMLKDGFSNLGSGAQFNNQHYAHKKLALNQTLFPNPLKTPDGKVVPVNETAKIKNANADGTLNPNGNHIKLMVKNFADGDFGDGKSLETTWDTRFTHGNMVNQQFHGQKFKITYNILKEDVAPTITPAQPAKIVSRKGVAINLNDVTAEDNEGGSGLDSLTNDAATQGLDVTNPAKGDYTITYTATDNNNNVATVTRQVEITDADDLQQVVNEATTELTKAYTALTKEKVAKKKQNAETIIAQNDATQAQIDQALAELTDAIRKLEVDTRKLVEAVNRYNNAPDYIREEPAVKTALQEASATNNDPNKTPEAVDTATNNLINALNNAERAEADRQTEATNVLKQIEGNDKKANRTPNAIQDVKTKINAIKDGTKRNALLRRLQVVETAYNDQKNALAELIANAKKPAITEGMSGTTVAQLQTAIQNAETTSTNANASQEALEMAINTLQTAINNLRADKTELETLINSVSAEPDYVKNDAEVVAKKAEAERVKNLSNPTVAEVKKAVRELTDALRAARQAEQDRQTEAIALLTKAETDKTVYVFDQAEAKINAIKDISVKNALTIRLQAAQQAYDNVKTALQNKITTAENPATTDAMTAESVARLQQAIAQAKNALADKTPQQTIETAHANLNQAITQLEVDMTALDQVIAEHTTLLNYIQTDPAVVTAKAEADRVKALPSPTKTEVQQAVSGLKTAVRNAKQAEQTRQDQAQQQIDQTTTNLSPATIATTQTKINDVKDTVKKAELQTKLNTLKQKLANQKQALRDLIVKAQKPDAVDGMTDATKNALTPKINGAITVRDDNQASSAQIETARQALQQAIDGLRADKTDLENALTDAEAEPEYLKGKSGFRRALENGRATRDNPNPTVAEVRNAVLALRNAKPEAVLQEAQAQQAMDEALQKAQQEIDKLPTLPDNQLLNIDIASLERLFDQVDEPVKKAELRNKLNVVKTAYNKRKAEVEAKYPKKPNSGYQKQANVGLLTALVSLPVTAIAVVAKKFKRQ